MVTAPLDMRVKRVMLRDGLSEEEILKREANQFTEEKKTGLSDFVIKNDNVELMIPQVLKLHELFLSMT